MHECKKFKLAILYQISGLLRKRVFCAWCFVRGAWGPCALCLVGRVNPLFYWEPAGSDPSVWVRVYGLGLGVGMLASDLLALDLAKDVALEHSRTTEELEFRRRHSLSVPDFQFNQVQGADQVRQLKKLVVLGFDALRELNRAR